MTSVSIFGSGNMGQAIGEVFEAGGADVQHLGRGTADPVRGDIVVLAVPWESLTDLVADRGDELGGHVVVDITNPLDFETFDKLKVPAGSSAAAALQAALPRSRVLKAFNTNFAATVAGRTVGTAPTTVLVAGDDNEGKRLFSEAVTAGGLRVVDAGSLSRAHELEALGFLQLTLAHDEKIGWSGGFTLTP